MRTAIRVYENSSAAEAAVDDLDAADFERCLIATTNQYLVDAEIDSVDDATAESFKTKAYPSSAAQTMLAASRFEAEVTGGFDNTSIGGVCIARSGPVVATAMSVTSGQLADGGAEARAARGAGQLCAAALTRAVEASHTT